MNSCIKKVLLPIYLIFFGVVLQSFISVSCYKVDDLNERGGNYEMVNIPGRDFMIGKYEVTQGEWQAVMGNNPSHVEIGEHHPVEWVSWVDVQEFIQKLNQKTGKRYRLPTEVEWEYACRGGTSGDRYGPLDEIAWYFGNSDFDTHPVGSKQPNAYGIYDMLGNVHEWCGDVYNRGGWNCVARGGSWASYASQVKATARGYLIDDLRNGRIGFRLAHDK